MRHKINNMKKEAPYKEIDRKKELESSQKPAFKRKITKG